MDYFLVNIDSRKLIEEIDDLLPRYFYLGYYKDKWHNLKNAIWAIRNYRKIVPSMVPWDFESILRMLKFQLGILRNAIANGHEEEVSRDKKVSNIERAIFLLDRIIEDDYPSIIDKDFWNKFTFRKKRINDKQYEFIVEDKEYIDAVREKAEKLQIAEWNELWDILRGDIPNGEWGMLSWWD